MMYDIFLKDDFSALSKNNVVLTFDPSGNDDVSTYLRFVKNGGNLVVINTDNNFEGGFSRLLSIIPRQMTKFDSVMALGEQQPTIKIPGLVKNIESKSSDVTIKSYYMNNNQLVTPFAIEKKYDAGRVVLVNAFGYFNAISKSPNSYFLTLGSIPHLMDLQANEEYTKPSVTNAIPSIRFVGDLKITGNSTINSSSLLLYGSKAFYAKDFSALNSSDLGYNAQHQKSNFKNVFIKDLKLYGQTQVIINSTGSLQLPLQPSVYDYITVSVPLPFNMTLKVSNGANAEATIGNSYVQKSLKFTSGEINFHGVGTDVLSTPPSSIHLLLKSPEIKANGNGSFKSLYWSPRINGEPFEIREKLSLKLGHADYYYYYEYADEKMGATDFVTYLKWLRVDRK